MARYYFDLGGQVPAHDIFGQEYPDDGAAKAHGVSIAHHVALDKPELAGNGNRIIVRDEKRTELFRLPIAIPERP